MYKITLPRYGSINVNTSVKGETIEQKMARILQNKEAIKDGAPLIFTERKDGVPIETDMRTDVMEHTIELLSAGTSKHRAARDKRHGIGQEAKDGMKKEGEDTATS